MLAAILNINERLAMSCLEVSMHVSLLSIGCKGSNVTIQDKKARLFLAILNWTGKGCFVLVGCHLCSRISNQVMNIRHVSVLIFLETSCIIVVIMRSWALCALN